MNKPTITTSTVTLDTTAMGGKKYVFVPITLTRITDEGMMLVSPKDVVKVARIRSLKNVIDGQRIADALKVE